MKFHSAQNLRKIRAISRWQPVAGLIFRGRKGRYPRFALTGSNPQNACRSLWIAAG